MRRYESGEHVTIRSLNGMPDLQLMRATYVRQTFPRHSHQGFGVGVIEQGALGFSYRGDTLVAPAGSINTVNPDEVHTGQSATENGWTYRMFYFSADFLQRLSNERSGRSTPLPFFVSGVVHDPGLAAFIQHVHVQVSDDQVSRLEKESLLLHLFSHLIARHTYNPMAADKVGREHLAVQRVIDYLDSHFGDELSLETLAGIAYLSPYHFIRVFSRQTGLTPHAWMMQLRAQKAKELLSQGLAIADVAVQTGFADQSHLSKTFKRLLGYTPGQFSNSVQDASLCSTIESFSYMKPLKPIGRQQWSAMSTAIRQRKQYD
jgi:AraC-like DNA-binding protein